jgi:hypothetical protein
VRATFDIYLTIQPEILSHIIYHIQAVHFKKAAWMWYIIPAKIAHPKVSEDARKAYPGFGLQESISALCTPVELRT